MKCDRPFCLQTLWLIGAGWILLALFVGETQLLDELPPAGVPLVVFALTALLLGSYFLIPSARAALEKWSDRSLLALHLTRFVGIYFLVLSSRGELDRRFGVPAGWGDIIAAMGAIVLIAWNVPPRWARLAWNAIGLVDILFVVARAASLRFPDPDALDALTRLPLSFLPTLIVPLIIATHVILFERWLKQPQPGAWEALSAT